MNKVLFNATILKKNNTGLGKYTYELLKQVVPELIKKGNNVEILCGNKEYLPKELWSYAYEINYNGKYSRNYNVKKYYKKCDKDTLIWSTTQHGYKTTAKQIVTIHDVTPIKFPKGRISQYIYYKFFLPSVLKNTDLVFTVSESTKKDIVDIYKYNHLNIKVVYEALENEKLEFDESSLKKYNLLKNEYFVIVGIHFPYKNIEIVLDALKNEKLKENRLVIIGNSNNEYGMKLKKYVDKLGIANRVQFTNYIENAQRNALIKNSKACIYPSLYEGFGLPVLEAMRIGVPIISSNASSLPEVGGEAAIYFNPYNIEELIKILDDVNNNRIDMEKRKELGIENLKKFNWEQVKENMLKEVEKIMI